MPFVAVRKDRPKGFCRGCFISINKSTLETAPVV